MPADRAVPSLRITYRGLLYEPRAYWEVKDPSPVFDGSQWHIFGTGGLSTGPEILHCTAPEMSGPWREQPTPVLHGVDDILYPCAPGVVAEGKELHLYLQHQFNVLGGRIEHLVSNDAGVSFVRTGTALTSNPETGEAGIYDPDAAEIGGGRYLTYAAMSVVGQPDIYLARSRTGDWSGPWDRLGCILDHASVPCHNQLGCVDYEWGLEGPQLLALPGVGVLLTAVCFLPDRPPGQRQRLLLAAAQEPTGPYTVLGTAVQPSDNDRGGENGHGTAVLGTDGLIHLVYQERHGLSDPWRFMRATMEVGVVATTLRAAQSAEMANRSFEGVQLSLSA